jgi:hypothetical protein
MGIKWFKPKGTLKGWKASQKPSTRMKHLRAAQRARGHGKITRKSKASVIRALVALANVTKSKKTERAARADARKLSKQLKRM